MSLTSFLLSGSGDHVQVIPISDQVWVTVNASVPSPWRYLNKKESRFEFSSSSSQYLPSVCCISLNLYLPEVCLVNLFAPVSVDMYACCFCLCEWYLSVELCMCLCGCLYVLYASLCTRSIWLIMYVCVSYELCVCPAFVSGICGCVCLTSVVCYESLSVCLMCDCCELQQKF